MKGQESSHIVAHMKSVGYENYILSDSLLKLDIQCRSPQIISMQVDVIKSMLQIKDK